MVVVGLGGSMNAKQACQTSTVRSSLFAPCSPPTIRDASSEKKKKEGRKCVQEASNE